MPPRDATFETIGLTSNHCILASFTTSGTAALTTDGERTGDFDSAREACVHYEIESADLSCGSSSTEVHESK